MSGVFPPRVSFVARGRDAYGDLLRDTRGLRREQQLARDAWFARLPWERKDDLLFELEILLKGMACFANPRNHPGPARRSPVIAHDFRPALALLRNGMVRVVQLSRFLLGERDKAFVFQRYLEMVLPEDSARSVLLREGTAQNTPEESLFALRHGFTNLLEITDGLLRLPRVPFRTFYAQAVGVQREIAHNAFFNPLSALEFRPEFDRIGSRPVLELIASVPGEQAHRLVALSFLSLFRMLRYLRLCETVLREHGDPRRNVGRLYLVLAALRSDARALSLYLRRRACALLADGYEQELLRVPAPDLRARQDHLLAEGHRLLAVRAALEGVAATLRLEMRRTFEHDLPSPEVEPSFDELRHRLNVGMANLRPTLQNAILFLARSLGAHLDAGGVFDEVGARRLSSERLRRDVWIFAQILRAFSLKARHAGAAEDRWSGPASLQFVKEFLSYFRSMGYPLLRVSDYPRFDAFLSAMGELEDTDLLDPARLDQATGEADAFHDYLADLFDQISKREELADLPFDKRNAAQALKLYLGH